MAMMDLPAMVLSALLECSHSNVSADETGMVTASTMLPAACMPTLMEDMGTPNRPASSVPIVSSVEDVKSSTLPDIVMYSVRTSPVPEIGGGEGAFVG